ncbi:MAG: hypothetical protein JXO72_07480 [Vicinamibacteria bacterium]|nr:hypothetical protein [Vicinamibacteria bacterium]
MPRRPCASWRQWTFPALVVAALTLLTEIPYIAGRCASPPARRFGGILLWVDDLNMYFSFIRQAADGHWLFVNRLTHLPHAPAFFNPEYLAVGLLIRWLSLTDTAAFALWRLAGVVVLIGGFAALLSVVETRPLVRKAALALFAFGGGLGWIVRLLGTWGIGTSLRKSWGAYLDLDLQSGLQPFAQAMLNPHFSLPHGLLLIVMTLYFMAERNGRAPYYVVAGIVAALSGLLRPYDLITLWTALPLFVLLAPEPLKSRRTVRRLLPLIVTAPILAYFVWLFSMHPIFRHWAGQGAIEPVPLLGQLIGLGLPGLVVVGRLCRPRARSFARVEERFCLAWLATVLILLHGRRWLPFLPFSPQLMMPTMGAVYVLALPAIRFGRPPALAFLVLLNSISSGVMIWERTRTVSTHHHYYHVRVADLAAYEWLNDAAREDDVILADELNGNRLGRFVSARVVLGHYSVTPWSDARRAEIGRLLFGELSAADAHAYLKTMGVRWLFFHPRRHPGFHPGRIPGCRIRYRARGVAIYSFDPRPRRS